MKTVTMKCYVNKKNCKAIWSALAFEGGLLTTTFKSYQFSVLYGISSPFCSSIHSTVCNSLLFYHLTQLGHFHYICVYSLMIYFLTWNCIVWCVTVFISLCYPHICMCNDSVIHLWFVTKISLVTTHRFPLFDKVSVQRRTKSTGIIHYSTTCIHTSIFLTRSHNAERYRHGTMIKRVI